MESNVSAILEITLDLYRAYRIDAKAIPDAAAMAIVEERKAG